MKNDQAILLDAYRRYEKLIPGKKKLTKRKQQIKSNELLHSLEKVLLFLNSPTTTECERNKNVNHGKRLLREYVELKNGDYHNKQLENKIERLIEQLSINEAKHVMTFRTMHTGGDRIDLEAIFRQDKNVKQLVQLPAQKVLEQAISDTEFTIVSKVDQKVYITDNGKKYHRANCPFCRRYRLVETSITMVQNGGYEPCKCIEEMMQKEEKQDINDRDNRSKNNITLGTNYVTVFIDESVRKSPWTKFDESLEESLASYSYIICKGKLDSELEIVKENEIDRNVCLANEAADTTYSAIEAITTVLMKLAFRHNFSGNVIIYTDNIAAMRLWNKQKEAISIATNFNSIKVSHISRNDNTKADALGREKSFCNVPLKLVNKLYLEHEENERMRQELEFVRLYFPNSKMNIPNLIEELQVLVDSKGGCVK